MPSSSALRTRVSTNVRVPVMRRNHRVDAPPADWRSNLRPESRQRIVNKIVETLRRHFPIAVYEIFYFASAFEQRIYTIARNQNDYLRKISLKMLSVETRNRNTSRVNPSPTNLVAGNQGAAN